MTKYQIFADKFFQISTLQKDEKLSFISLMETNFKSYGFEKVTKRFNGERKYSMALRFERMKTDNIGEWIEIVFDKYGGRKFYIHLGVTELIPTHKHIQLGALVSRKNQYQHWWGSKWHSISRKRAWLKAINSIEKYIPQMVTYLEDGRAEKNIHDHDIGNMIDTTPPTTRKPHTQIKPPFIPAQAGVNGDRCKLPAKTPSPRPMTRRQQAAGKGHSMS